MLELAVTKVLTSFVLKALQVLVDQSKKANSPLKGHERTVQYLQHLGECEEEQYFCEVLFLFGLVVLLLFGSFLEAIKLKRYPCYLVGFLHNATFKYYFKGFKFG